MGKHSEKINRQKKSIDKTIRIDDLSQIENSKQKNTRKKKKISNVENTHNKATKNKGVQNKEKKQKKPISKFKKFLLKIIIFIFLATLIAFGIWQALEAHKWQTLAKQMCNNANSVVVDIQRKYYCYTWKSKNS